MIEAKERDTASDTAQLILEFRALTVAEKAYWEFMHDLFILYRDQQRSHRVVECNATRTKKMMKILRLEFYNLREEAQAQLVRDHLAVRWRDENLTFAQQSCEQEDRNLIHDIRKDVARIIVRIDEAMRGIKSVEGEGKGKGKGKGKGEGEGKGKGEGI